jgi:hypothetical protein
LLEHPCDQHGRNKDDNPADDHQIGGVPCRFVEISIFPDNVKVLKPVPFPGVSMSLPVGESIEDRRREGKKDEGDIEDELRRDERNDEFAPRLLKHRISLGM